jgi:hypothetical protein
LLACTTEGEDFLLLSWDETGVFRFEPETKPLWLEYHHITFVKKNEFECVLSEEKIPGYRLLK